MQAMKCPYCNGDVEYTSAAKVYRKEGFGYLYLCKGFPACDAYVAAGDDGRPIGSLANRALRDQRKKLYELITRVSTEQKVPRQEVNSLVGKLRGQRVFRINDLRETELSSILGDIEGFVEAIVKALAPSQDVGTQALKLPLRYLFIESHGRPAGALPYASYRGHLKVLNEAVKLGLVNKITKHGTRKIFFVLTQAGKTLIGYDLSPTREPAYA